MRMRTAFGGPISSTVAAQQTYLSPLSSTSLSLGRRVDVSLRSISTLTMAEQAFLKQPIVFLSSKKTEKVLQAIGLGIMTPREAIEGRILAGTCHSAKMKRTLIVRRNYLHWVTKYQRYEKRHSNIPAHVSPCFRVKECDHVIIGQCRPLSNTVRFSVLKVIPAGSSGGKKAFTGS